MAIGVAIAVLPVTINSLRHGQSLGTGAEDTRESAAREAAHWNHHLRRSRVVPATPTGELESMDEGPVVGTPLGAPRP